jgi:RNA polymerase sigma-70 factor (ECF subfamily)
VLDFPSIVRWFPPASPAAGSAGEARALNVAAVHAEYADFVWKSLQRLGVGAADREDLLQEVFIIVHRRLHTFRQEELISPWLFGICRNVASAHRRRAYMRRETPCESLPEVDAEHAGRSPEEAARIGEAQRALAAILDGIDLDRRVVFVMFEIEEMSLNEIAAILGIPAGTVSSRLHAARKAFEKALARMERDP